MTRQHMTRHGQVVVLGALPDALALVHQYLTEIDVPHECWAGEVYNIGLTSSALMFPLSHNRSNDMRR